MVEALIGQGLPLNIVRDDAGNVTEILFEENVSGQCSYSFKIRITTQTEFHNLTGSRMVMFYDSAFTMGNRDMSINGIWLFETVFSDAKNLAKCLGHELVHAHDFVRFGNSPFYSIRTELRASMWTLKNWFKMRWPF